MAWKVWLVAFKNGSYRLGVRGLGPKWEVQLKDKIADAEQIYGSQIPHRVIAKTPKGFRIMTPTEAMKKKYPIEHYVGW